MKFILIVEMNSKFHQNINFLNKIENAFQPQEDDKDWHLEHYFNLNVCPSIYGLQFHSP